MVAAPRRERPPNTGDADALAAWALKTDVEAVLEQWTAFAGGLGPHKVPHRGICTNEWYFSLFEARSGSC